MTKTTSVTLSLLGQHSSQTTAGELREACPSLCADSQEGGLAREPGVLPGQPGWSPGNHSHRTPGRVHPCAGFRGSQFQTGPCPGPQWLIKATPTVPPGSGQAPATGRRCPLTWSACIGTARPARHVLETPLVTPQLRPGTKQGHPTLGPSQIGVRKKGDTQPGQGP